MKTNGLQSSCTHGEKTTSVRNADHRNYCQNKNRTFLFDIFQTKSSFSNFLKTKSAFISLYCFSSKVITFLDLLFFITIFLVICFNLKRFTE